MSIDLPILPGSPPDPGPPPPAPSDASRLGALFDSHGRQIRDLRLSVTDRCNYRCVYCMDPDFRYMPRRELLSRDEYITIARVCRSLGIDKLRLTGGEPTLYRDLDDLIDAVGAMGFDDVAMTTNGSLLTPERARRWSEAGLDRLTFSLDSLRPERVAAITRTRGGPETVIRAIDVARAAGLGPLKVNAVVMRGVNDDEITDFADFAREHGVDMRLIEFMPLDSSRAWARDSVVSADEMIAAMKTRHDLVPVDRDDPSSTSLVYRFSDGTPGRVGIIASVTQNFCGACSRLRITADGKVRPCLFSHREWDIRSVLRSGADDREVASFIVDSVWTKQAGHAIGRDGFVQPAHTMSSIGG